MLASWKKGWGRKASFIRFCLALIDSQRAHFEMDAFKKSTVLSYFNIFCLRSRKNKTWLGKSLIRKYQ